MKKLLTQKSSINVLRFHCKEGNIENVTKLLELVSPLDYLNEEQMWFTLSEARKSSWAFPEHKEAFDKVCSHLRAIFQIREVAYPPQTTL